jgi:hypothetical protein
MPAFDAFASSLYDEFTLDARPPAWRGRDRAAEFLSVNSDPLDRYAFLI